MKVGNGYLTRFYINKSLQKLALFGLVLLYSKENKILYVFREGLPAINTEKDQALGPGFPSKTILNNEQE